MFSFLHLWLCVSPSRSFRFFSLFRSNSSASSFSPTGTDVMASSSPNAETILAGGNLILSLRQAFETRQVDLILASQSPRRREILDMMGLAGLYTTIPSPLDEAALQDELTKAGITKDPQRYTQTLATEKARTLAETLNDVTCPTIILGSDTIVDQDEAILEKPIDTADAKRMLHQLSGREHYVHTGVALYVCLPGGTAPKLVVSFVDQAVVQFTTLDEADIEAYVASGEPMDKAGSYGIQGMGGQFVSSVQGDFFTVRYFIRVIKICVVWSVFLHLPSCISLQVMGLPMHRTSSVMANVVKKALQDIL